MTDLSSLPFSLPERAPVTRIRMVNDEAKPVAAKQRTQGLPGFEERYTDIVDYIVRITDEIWRDRAIGYIYDTYSADCTVYTSDMVVRTAEQVVQRSLAALNAAPDVELRHLNVAWKSDDDVEYYTAHLGFDRSTDAVPSKYGPATGRRYLMRFAADCISRDNQIHTEWLVHDDGAMCRQLDFDLDEVARSLAEVALAEPYHPVASGHAVAAAEGSAEAWVCALFDRVWNARRFDAIANFYAPEAIVHWVGGKTLQGTTGVRDAIINLLAALPDGRIAVEHVCWSDETDGIIVAVRWTLSGTSARGGLLGMQLPEGQPVSIMGISHLRFGGGGRVVEEWTVFSEIAARAMAYRGAAQAMPIGADDD